MIVVTDMVGTLTAGAPVRSIAAWIRQHQSVWRARRLMYTMLIPYVLSKIGLLDAQRFGQWAMRLALAAVQNPTDELVETLSAWVLENEVWPKRREDVLARIAEHGAAGANVYIVSTAWDPLVRALAARIGAQPIGSPVTIENGRISIVGEAVGGQSKQQAIRARLGAESVAFAYGDSWADVPMLELADHPVAVYPDSRLRGHASEMGWEILDAEPPPESG